jgi:hypothetical protein
MCNVFDAGMPRITGEWLSHGRVCREGFFPLGLWKEIAYSESKESDAARGQYKQNLSCYYVKLQGLLKVLHHLWPMIGITDSKPHEPYGLQTV